ncbi:MAG: DUF2027 domain-containing protein [Bacteroidales bacterium]
MKLQVGDKVKFMDQKGGGVVSRILNSTTVNVLTDDDFEIPFAVHDLLKIEKPKSYSEKIFFEGLSPSFPGSESKFGAGSGKEAENLSSPPMEEKMEASLENTNLEEDTDKRISALHHGYVSKTSQAEGLYLGFLPHDQQWMMKGGIDLYIIYNLASKGVESFYGVDYASVPPYSKILVESLERDEIGLWSEGVFQCLFYQEESSCWLMPVSCAYELKTKRFLQTENYIYPVFLREKILLLPLVNINEHKAQNAIVHSTPFEDRNSSASSQKQMLRPIQNESFLAPFFIDKNTVEIDLHIESLVENISDMQAYEILQLQIKHFERCLNEAIEKKVSKIIFIHGVGNGSLKQEMKKILKPYTGLHYLDASSAKYGHGAMEIYFSGK